ncbi:TetR family transcriptional regulator [Anaerobacterium chartisolvens]|uniref:TetR family transcriptional regulator n=1 Tax=Anaerobacterium chartisolvens TaxID=1297424 RepID=A0A369AGL7_9FIRM|nr:TetR/AcrR family transcriptional regulator [Anaerobacterium chartisolvens]RCX08502.1 TetR family transcriptional regulator [Anaerobacterium chartisolvens]
MAETGGKMKWRQENAENPLNGNPMLFEAALDAFSTNSFREASLNDIIKAAGMNKGSFYYRFYDKLDLYLSLLQRLSVEKLALFQQYDDTNTEDDFFVSIKKKAMLGIRFARKEPRYNALSRRFLTEETGFRQTVLDAFGGVTENVLLRMTEDAQQKGQIRGDVSAQMMAKVFAILIERIDKVILPDMEDEEILGKIDQLIAVLRDGTGVKRDKGTADQCHKA